MNEGNILLIYWRYFF